jgi:hypothetical protein
MTSGGSRPATAIVHPIILIQFRSIGAITLSRTHEAVAMNARPQVRH